MKIILNYVYKKQMRVQLIGVYERRLIIVFLKKKYSIKICDSTCKSLLSKLIISLSCHHFYNDIILSFYVLRHNRVIGEILVNKIDENNY